MISFDGGPLVIGHDDDGSPACAWPTMPDAPSFLGRSSQSRAPVSAECDILHAVAFRRGRIGDTL